MNTIGIFFDKVARVQLKFVFVDNEVELMFGCI